MIRTRRPGGVADRRRWSLGPRGVAASAWGAAVASLPTRDSAPRTGGPHARRRIAVRLLGDRHRHVDDRTAPARRSRCTDADGTIEIVSAAGVVIDEGRHTYVRDPRTAPGWTSVLVEPDTGDLPGRAAIGT